MSQSKHINYEPQVGTTISYAAQEAVKLAQKESTPVTLKFNSVSLTVNSQSKPQDVVKDYYKQMDAKAEAYRNSPVGKTAAEKLQKQNAADQEKINTLVGDLPQALGKGLTTTIKWVQEYADVADNINLNYRGKEVLTALTSAGFKANEFTGDKFVKGDKEIMGRYILGQVVDNLQSGMPPHPMASHFAEQYLAMPDVKPAGTKPSFKPPQA